MADLSDEIEAAASKPQSVSVDGQTVNARSIQDLIAADEYLKANEAVASRKRGFVIQRFKPPGSV